MTTILCIDDEPDALEVRKLLLESAGYRVIQAASGKQGLKLFSVAVINLVLVDYWMPGMNGLAVARQIKELDPDMPIVMISGLAELPGEAVGIADRWILKGHPVQDLLDTLAELTQT